MSNNKGVVGCYAANVVQIVDTAARSVGATVTVPHAVGVGLGISPDGGYAVVTHGGSDAATVINVNSAVVVGTVSTPSFAAGCAASDTTGYVCCQGGTVEVIDLASATVTTNISFPSGAAPQYCAVDDAGAYLYVSYALNPSGGTYLAKIDTSTNTIVSTLTLSASITGAGPVAVDAAGLVGAVASNGSTAWWTVDLTGPTLVAQYTLAPAITDVSVSPDGSTVYLAAVTLVRSAAWVSGFTNWQITTGISPFGVCVDGFNNYLWIAGATAATDMAIAYVPTHAVTNLPGFSGPLTVRVRGGLAAEPIVMIV